MDHRRFCAWAYWLLAGLLAMPALTAVVPSPAHAEARTVRVALQNNPLMAFADENGRPGGVFIDVLQHVAAEQEWKLEWVPCNFSACLTKLTDAEIDLMSALAYSGERARKFDFTQETVFNNWAVVLQTPGSDIHSIADLEGLRVATSKGNIHTRALRRTLESFNIQSQIVIVDDYPDVVQALLAGDVSAGIVNRLGALMAAHRPGIEKTAIIFNPVELRFATGKGGNADLRAALDQAMAALKADKNSAYYASLEKWLFEEAQRTAVPYWIWWVLAVAGGVLSGVFLWNRRLNMEIAERKRLEEKLHQSHDLFFRAFQSNPNLMALVDPSTGEHVDVNEAFLDTLKFSREEVIGKTSFDLKHWADFRDRERVLKEHSEHGRVRDFVGQLKAKDGTLIDCSFSTEPIEMDRSKLVLWTVIDITESKHAEEEVRNAKETAEVANQAKSEFLASMSHDLRTPLTAILGFSTLIKDQILGPDKDATYAEYGEDIHKSGRHLLRLINDLLDLSKIEAGKLELNFESLDVEEMVLESIHIIETVAARSDVDVRAELDKNLPLLTADRRAFDQIVLNLLSNAIKFTPQGGRVTVRGSSNGNKTHLVIVDTGIGIKPEHIEKVLTPWGQVTDPMTTGAKGSGLGLPIVKSLVELHGGKLDIKSKVGKGTTVTVTLPNAGP